VNTYKIRLFGSSTTIPLDIERSEASNSRLTQWAERTLPLYWPIYHTLNAWKTDKNDEVSTLVLVLQSYVAVKETKL